MRTVMTATPFECFMRIRPVRNVSALAWLAACLLAGPAGVHAQGAITDGTTPPTIEPGAPASSYPLSSFETYSPFTGKVSIAVPIRHIGGRGSASFDMRVRIVDEWSADKTPTGNSQYPFQATPNLGFWQKWQAGYGPGTVFGRESVVTVNPCPNGQTEIPQYTLSRLTFTGPDGTETEMRDTNTDGAPYRVPSYCTTNASSWDAGRGKVFASRDGSGVVFVSTTTVTDYPVVTGANPVFLVNGYLYLPDGTAYKVVNSNIASIRDRNGNTITFTYNSADQVTRIVDQNGRTTTVTYGTTSCAGSPQRYCDLISYTGWMGAETVEVGSQDLDVNLRSGYSPESITTLFPELVSPNYPATSTDFNTTNYSYVRYPDGHQVTFQYNSYAEVARVTLPTGGAIEYDWSGYDGPGADGFAGSATQSGSVMIDRMVLTRREYPDTAGSSLGGTTSYSYVYSTAGDGTPRQVTTEKVTVGSSATLLSQTVHTYWGNANDGLLFNGIAYGNWQEGQELSTAYGSPVVKTASNTWQQSGTVVQSYCRRTVCVRGEQWGRIPGE